MFSVILLASEVIMANKSTFFWHFLLNLMSGVNRCNNYRLKSSKQDPTGQLLISDLTRDSTAGQSPAAALLLSGFDLILFLGDTLR